MGNLKPSLDFLPVTAREWAYLAGILDGEGCVYARRGYEKGRLSGPTFHGRLSVGSSDFVLMAWLTQHIPGGNVSSPSRGAKSTKDHWQWRVGKRPAVEKILVETFPYLVIKRNQAELVLELCHLPRPSKPRQQEIHQALKELKR